VQAFLHVPLYNKLYERFKAYPLPSAIGIEQEMVGLGVSPKQKAKARQAFQRSAEQAGFLDESSSRLIKPSGLETQGTSAVTRDTRPLAPAPNPIVSSLPQNQYGGNGGGGNNGLQALQDNHLVQGLFEELIPLDSPWTKEQHDEWIELAKVILKRIHPLTSSGGNMQP
jgi:hypothetical protein